MTDYIRREGNGHGRLHDFDHRSPEEIQRELDATRHQMADTIHAIERELSSGQLMMRVLGMFRSGPGRFSENLGQTIVNNPIPVAMIGLGVIMLSRSGARQTEYVGVGEYQEGGGKIAHATEVAKDKLHSAKEKVSHARESISHTAGRARELGHRSSERVRHSVHSVQRTMNENPMLVGLVAIAAGAFLAAALPTTRREREVIGPRRDRLVSEAKRTARAAVEGVKSGVEQAQQTEVVAPGDEPLTSDLYPEGRTIR
jgi:hypothetical protein